MQEEMQRVIDGLRAEMEEIKDQKEREVKLLKESIAE